MWRGLEGSSRPRSWSAEPRLTSRGRTARSCASSRASPPSRRPRDGARSGSRRPIPWEAARGPRPVEEDAGQAEDPVGGAVDVGLLLERLEPRGARPGAMARSQSSGWPRECSWIRSTWSTRSHSSERWRLFARLGRGPARSSSRERSPSRGGPSTDRCGARSRRVELQR